MSIKELEMQLKLCEKELEAATQDLSPLNQEHKIKWRELHRKCLKLEQELALAQGEEAACHFEWPVKWDAGAPIPYLLSGEGRVFLLYYVSEIVPEYDKFVVKVIDETDSNVDQVALVEFLRCYDLRFGGPNDEVFQGHPLFGKGLQLYGAHIVENSKWLKGVEQINKVHRGYDPDDWKRLKHYLLLFHDELFECLARSYYIEVYTRDFYEVLEIAMNKVSGREKWLKK